MSRKTNQRSQAAASATWARKNTKPSFSRRIVLGVTVVAVCAILVSHGVPIDLTAVTHHIMGGASSSRLPVPVIEKKMDCNVASYTKDAHDCAQHMHCGRWVFDDVFEPEVLTAMEEMIDDILARAQGGGAGPPSVIDLHGRVVSYKEKFLNLDVVFGHYKWNVSRAHIDHYKNIRTTIHQTIRGLSGLPGERIYMDRAFFSHINGTKTAKTVHDEYWHNHIDVEQYGTFTYTSLLYFGGSDAFTGGDFIFTNDGQRILPKRNRLLIFSSGEENPHKVDPVTTGIRIAFTSAVTCNVDASVDLNAL